MLNFALHFSQFSDETVTMKSIDVLTFWFEECGPKDWFQKNLEFDALIQKRFSKTHQKAASLELFDWRQTPQGRLAEIIVLDQFSRNMFRDKPESFAFDGIALTLSQEAVNAGDDKALTEQERQFLYMPYMHSESRVIHEEAVKLYDSIDHSYGYEYELKHKEIIDRFGRYPHRNEILGRKSTDEELEFLKQPGSSF